MLNRLLVAAVAVLVLVVVVTAVLDRLGDDGTTTALPSCLPSQLDVSLRAQAAPRVVTRLANGPRCRLDAIPVRVFLQEEGCADRLLGGLDCRDERIPSSPAELTGTLSAGGELASAFRYPPTCKPRVLALTVGPVTNYETLPGRSCLG